MTADQNSPENPDNDADQAFDPDEVQARVEHDPADNHGIGLEGDGPSKADKADGLVSGS